MSGASLNAIDVSVEFAGLSALSGVSLALGPARSSG